MPKLYHRATGPSKQKVFLATPVSDRPLPGYTFALYESATALAQAGIGAELALYAGNCHVDDSRNVLVRDFLESDCTDLVFIDSDIRWEPSDLVRLLGYDRDVVGATYPFKQDDEGFPVAWLPGPMEADPDGLVEVQGLPTGFLRIRRHVFERMDEAAIHFKPKTDSKGAIPLIFERTIDNQCRRGGDYTFCWKWREMGGKLHVAPEIYLEHGGTHEWGGSLGHFQRMELYGGVKAAIMEVQHGLESPKTLNDAFSEWGNDWAVDGPVLEVLISLARPLTGPVLELGSGLSTLLMAAANPNVMIHALEHDSGWAEKVDEIATRCGLENIDIWCAPLVDGWYDPRTIPGQNWSMVFCDGPPRYLASREKVFELLDIGDEVLFVADDAETLKGVDQWAESKGRQVHRIGGVRKIAISKAA